MIAQWREGVTDRMRLIDRPEVVWFIFPMPELESIRSILDKVLLQANAAQVSEVHLALGEISKINEEAIQQHWEEISRGTLAERARLHFRLIAAEVQCMSCFQEYHPVDGRIHCPYCGSFGAKILAGEEFHLESIETDHE